MSTSKEKIDKHIGDAFNSKKVNFNKTTQIEYNGKPLKSASQYYWKVRVWDKNKKVCQ